MTYRLRLQTSILVLVAIAASCTTDPSSTGVGDGTSTTAQLPSAATAVTVNEPTLDLDCQPAITEVGGIGSEVRASSGDGFEVWALIFNTWDLPDGDPVKIPAQQEVKIVWRATGDSHLLLEAMRPDGSTVVPDWGPEAHLSSNWNRPGDEWGTGWTFPEAGCWTFRISRGNETATLTADVFE